MLLGVVVLAGLFLLVGCTDGGSQAHPHGHASHSDNIKLNMRSEHDSGVSGTASFEDTSDGIVVKLDLSGLPKPNTLYLAHVHPGTCAEGEAIPADWNEVYADYLLALAKYPEPVFPSLAALLKFEEGDTYWRKIGRMQGV